MPWRYGIIKYRNKNNPEYRFYGIGELYYDKDPLAPHSCTQDPTEVYCDDESDSTEKSIKEEIKWALQAMLKDCMTYPIFDIDGPYAKAPWDAERSIQDLTAEQLNSMSDEEIEEWIRKKKD